MNRKKLVALIGAATIMLALAGCGDKAEPTGYDSYRDTFSAKYFLEKTPEYAADEELLATAVEVIRNQEESLEERLKAAELLCEAEYLRASEANESDETLSRDDFLYPDSGAYAAEAFAALEDADNTEFWETLEASYATKELMFAAAPHFTPSMVLQFYDDRDKAGDLTEMYLTNVIARALETNTTNLYALAETMFENGYFDPDSHYGAVDAFTKIKDVIHTVDDGLEYIAFFAETAVPLLESYYPDNYTSWRTKASDEEISYFRPGLRFALNDDAIDTSHLQAGSTDSPASVPTGKVLALIENGSQDEYPEAGTAVVMDGDFLLNLPAERIPTSLDDVDYIVAITSMYENVGEYQSDGKSVSEENPIFAIASFSSIDLKDWHTGAHLGTYGTVESDAPNTIVVVNSNSRGRKYAFAPYPNENDIYQTVEAYL